MVEFLPAVGVTLFLTGIFVYFLVNADIHDIKSNWKERRCDLSVMMMSGLMKPDGDERTGTQFAMDNLQFCMESIIDRVLKSAFAPFYAVAKQQANAQESMKTPLNNLRSILTNARGTLNSFLSSKFIQYNIITHLAMKGWQHLRFMMGRITSIAFSLTYLGLSLSATISNLTDWIINTTTIIMLVLAALSFLLFFIMWPFIPIIITSIVFLAQAGKAIDAGPFCVDPDIRVVLESGFTKRLGEIKLGDRLKAIDSSRENIVTGILEVDARDISLVSVNGVRMSGSHRVYYNGTWVLAKEHPNALCLNENIERLICLNTTAHCVPCTPLIPLNRQEKIVWAGDWEEVDTEEGRTTWIDLVHSHLNRGEVATGQGAYPTSIPLMGLDVKVMEKERGCIPIRSVKIGDYVERGFGKYTKVCGIYDGTIVTENAQTTSEWISDGVWRFLDKQWVTDGTVKSSISGRHRVQGRMLVTEGEEYTVILRDKIHLVRDFTEIGASHIHETYDILDASINKN